MSSSRKFVLSSGSRGGITDSDQTYDIVPVHSVQGLRTVNPGIRDKLDRKAFFEESIHFGPPPTHIGMLFKVG